MNIFYLKHFIFLILNKRYELSKNPHPVEIEGMFYHEF